MLEAESGPELIDPEIDVHEAVSTDSVNPAGALILYRYQATVEQRLQMLGHGRAADWQAARKLIDRLGLPSQLLQKVPPVRIGDSVEHIVGHTTKLR